MKKILIIDDEEDIRELVKITLGAKYEVIEAYDGLSGLDIVKDEKPDLILLDMMMPIVSGTDVCKRLKSSPDTADIPIVIITAGGIEAAMKGMSEKADQFLIKPFTTDQIEEKVDKLLNKS
ncbi:response regulator [bacterium]|jgi:DNA-binding response OmpR family regulator|nr:response regulator [bacterium]